MTEAPACESDLAFCMLLKQSYEYVQTMKGRWKLKYQGP